MIIAGLYDDLHYHKAVALAERVAAAAPEDAEFSFEKVPYFEPEWDAFLEAKILELGGDAYAHKSSPFITKDGEYMGGVSALTEFVVSTFSDVAVTFDEPDSKFKDTALNALLEAMNSTGASYCYMDIKVGDAKGKRVVYELNARDCPKTCENFMTLCEGSTKKLRYKGSPIHRIVQGGWIQGGDIVSGKGDGGLSIFGDFFPDETFAMRFDGPGVLAMANTGAHSNSSQFFVTLRALPNLNNRNVAFGRVIRGMSVIRSLDSLETANDRPLTKVVVDKSGVVDLKTVTDLLK